MLEELQVKNLLLYLEMVVSIYTEKHKLQAPLISLLQKYKRVTEAISKYPMKYSQTSTIFQSIEFPVQKAQVLLSGYAQSTFAGFSQQNFCT